MKSVSKILAVSLMIAAIAGSLPAIAHDHHHHELAAKEPSLSGSSLYNIEGSWKNEKGEAVAFSSLKGRVRLVAMLYTGCKTACPMIAQDLKSLRERLPRGLRSQITLTVFSLDPDNDTQEKMKAFRENLKLEANAFELYSPTSASDVTTLAAALGVQYKKLDSGEYIHSNLVFLLNPEGEIAAKKEGLKTNSEDFNASIRKLAQNRAQ